MERDREGADLRQRFRNQVAAVGRDAEQRLRLIAETTDALVSETLTNRERSQLLRGFVSTLRPSEEEMCLFATRLGAAPPSMKNALAGALPRQYLPALHGRTERQEATEPPGGSTDPGPTQTSDHDAGSDATGEQGLSQGTVVLLSGTDNQPGNKHLLARHNFGAARIATVDALCRFLQETNDVVAVVIDGTFLLELGSKEAQAELFRTLGSHSSFMWLRVDHTNLLLTRFEVQTILKETWCERGDISVNRLTITWGSALVEDELNCVKASSRVLSTIERITFLPGELSDREAATLAAAAAERARGWRDVVAPETLTLSVRFLSGGKTDAKVAVLTIDGVGAPIVAKIAETPIVLDEVRRFRTFIEHWDPQLRPSAHIHGEVGVILFGLVQDGESDMRPAPTLGNRLKDLWVSELYGEHDGFTAPDPDDMIRAITSAREKLLHLNQQPCSDNEIECYSDPHISGFERLEQHDVTMGFSDGARRARAIALDRYKTMNSRATVHGDVNLRNILLQGDRISYLIDYAYSGPGHPAVDLARLELALYLGPFQQAGSDEECRALQTALTIDRCGINYLHERFPGILKLETNRVCVDGCVKARDAALQVVRAFGGDERDYLAAKLLLAWYALALEGLNSGLARGVIEVISNEILTWTD